MNFVGFCCNVSWTTMSQAGKYDAESLTDHLCYSSLIIIFLHKKGDRSCFDFPTGTEALPEGESLNLCEILKTHFPYTRMHCSGHVAAASAYGAP